MSLETIEIDSDTRACFTQPLLRWYGTSGRDLPWRQTTNPYAIWVSEIMLQQTQVRTVLPYYQRFLKAFPTLNAFASADLEVVLKLWQGLGYYARARHLHRAAKEVVARFDGEVPSTYPLLSKLPGIGRSTAGAILTIAFGQRHPILDGNVRRVLCRFFAIQKDPRDKDIEAWLWQCSEKLLPRQKADLYLQAIMDLGATCCTPKAPRCFGCPLKKSCRGFDEGVQDLLPVRPPAKKIPHYDYFAGVLISGDAVLIRRRPLKGLLAGLWEFPGERVVRGDKDLSIIKSYEQFFSGKIDFNGCRSYPWMIIRHVFTHFKMTLHVFACHLENQARLAVPLKWVPRRTLETYPFSTAHQKIVLKLLASAGQPDLLQAQLNTDA